MEANKYFKVIVERRIPFFTNTFSAILSCCFIFFLLLYILLYPFKYLSPELHILVIITFIPQFLAKAFYYASIIAIVSYLLVVGIRLHKKAVLSFTENFLVIRNRTLKFIIPIKSISIIYWFDIKNTEGQLTKIKLRVEEKNGNVTRFTLMYYDSQADELMNQLILYKDLFEVKFYDFDVGPDVDDDQEKNIAV